MPNRIDRFSGKFRFLSNFWIVSVPLDNEWYPSVEHAYQAAKTTDSENRRRIRYSLSPADAKRLGSNVILRQDWEQVKLQYMRYLVWEKFSLHIDLGQKLLDTTDTELIEGNTWGDKFWGVCRGIGENWLGKILMETRSLLAYYRGIEHDGQK